MRTLHETVAELRNFCVVFAFWSPLVVPNVEITQKSPSYACITVAMCLYCIDGWQGEWIVNVWSTQTHSMTIALNQGACSVIVHAQCMCERTNTVCIVPQHDHQMTDICNVHISQFSTRSDNRLQLSDIEPVLPDNIFGSPRRVFCSL